MQNPKTTRHRVTAYVLVAGLLLGAGVLFGSVRWSISSGGHTLIEVAATLLSTVVGVIALVRFYSRKSNTYLFIGAGFLGTALLDGYHAVATFAPFAGAFPSLTPNLVAWSWVASRMFLSVLLAVSWWAYNREATKGPEGQIPELIVYRVVGGLTLASFLFFFFVPLPPAHYPDFIFGRPEEFVPGLFFALALVGYLRAGLWKEDRFTHYLVLSIIVGLAVQVAFMPFSVQPFDAYFTSAHLLKQASYILLLIGLLVSMYHLFRQADESVQEITGINQSLQLEIAARDQAEQELRRSRDELEVRVRERTAQISSSNEKLEAAIDEYEKSEQALRLSEAQIRLLLNSTGEAIFGVNLEGKCTFCNRTFLRLLGYEVETELLGETLHDLIHHTHPDGAEYCVEDCTIHQAFKENQGGHSDTEILWRRDGTSFPAELWSYPLEQEGEVTGCVVTFVDISERRKAELSLQEAKEGAELASRAKSEFLANMSHELRTPLNGILGYAQILEIDETLSDAQRRGVNVIGRSGEHLLTLINDILDLSKIEAGKLEAQEAEFHLPDLLKNLADIERTRAEQQGLAFIFEELSPLPELVYGDERRLRQILLNLLGNAIKFTESGGIALKVGYDDCSNKKPLLRFQVEDTGVGIGPENLTAIFEPFRQVAASASAIEGTGLGLAISRRLSEMLGAELKVRSTPGQGSVFWFELDLPAVEGLPMESSPTIQSIVGYQGPTKHVLIVDDREQNRAVLRGMLEPVGFAIDEATNGQEAIEKAGQIKPDLILMDLVMPVMDGFEATRRIREKPGLSETRVIALSASVFEYSQQQSLDVGCDDFIPKPVRRDVLLERLEQLLNLEWKYRTNIEAGRNHVHLLPATGPVPEGPSAQQAEVLFSAALQGDVQGLLDILALQENVGEPDHPVGQQIRELAATYRMGKIRELIKPYLSTDA